MSCELPACANMTCFIGCTFTVTGRQFEKCQQVTFFIFFLLINSAILWDKSKAYNWFRVQTVNGQLIRGFRSDRQRIIRHPWVSSKVGYLSFDKESQCIKGKKSSLTWQRTFGDRQRENFAKRFVVWRDRRGVEGGGSGEIGRIVVLRQNVLRKERELW